MRISDWSSDVCSSDLRDVVVTGRAKDIIIRNGENIAPKEIEDLLLGHPQIAEVAIVGVPDARTGERAIAVIVPKSNASAPDVASLAGFLIGTGIAKYKIPEQVALWDRSEEHTSELQSLMSISYAVFCLQKNKYHNKQPVS